MRERQGPLGQAFSEETRKEGRQERRETTGAGRFPIVPPVINQDRCGWNRHMKWRRKKGEQPERGEEKRRSNLRDRNQAMKEVSVWEEEIKEKGRDGKTLKTKIQGSRQKTVVIKTLTMFLFCCLQAVPHLQWEEECMWHSNLPQTSTNILLKFPSLKKTKAKQMRVHRYRMNG